MEFFNFCLEIIEQEAERFNVDLKKFNFANEITAATANDVNYDIAHNRCAYIYRCGAINISFAKDCFTRFVTEYGDLLPLISKWNTNPNLIISTFSKGPTFDYVAFLLAYYTYLPQTPFSLFKKINMISKYGAWRNTVTIMQRIINEGYLKPLSSASFENCEVIQGDPFDSFTEKIRIPISQSDVIMMIKSIKLSDSSDEKRVSSAVKVLIETLKPEAILFCIDTKPVTALIDSVLSKFHGKYLFDPVYVNTILDFDCPDAFKTTFGCSPVISARGIFFVWQKLSQMIKSPVNHQTSKLFSENQNVKANDSKLSSTPCDETNLTISKDCNSSSPYFPKLCIEPKVNSSGNMKNIDHISEKNASSGNKIYPALTSLNCSADSYEHTNAAAYIDAVKENTNSHISFNKFMQTEEGRVETDSSRIVALTNKITNLTESIRKLLQMNELQSTCGKVIPPCSVECTETSVPSSSSNFCSSSCSFIQNSKHSCCSNCVHCRKDCINHCQNNRCNQVCLSHDDDHCCALPNNSYHSQNCTFSCCDRRVIKTESKQCINQNTPNLVIPLNNLSKEFESIIISSLSKSDLNN